MKPCITVSFSKPRVRQLVSLIGISVFLFATSFATSTVIAGRRKRFNPQVRNAPTQASAAGGKRGCPGDKGIPLTLLSPQTYVGETASKRPTFAWYMPKPDKAIFAIYEVEPNRQKKQVVQNEEINASQGINKFALTQTHPELLPGKRYFWQIAIRCPNGSTYQASEFEIVKASVKGRNLVSNNNMQTIDTLAEAGLWYEAFAEAIKLAPSGKLDANGAGLILDLADSETYSSEPERIKHLQEIAKQ
jgi:Domain of Unknown Function (DUF928)